MKQNQSSAITGKKLYLNGLIAGICITILLSSCCITEPVGTPTSKRNCNCPKGDLAVTHQKQPSQENVSGISNSPADVQTDTQSGLLVKNTTPASAVGQSALNMPVVLNKGKGKKLPFGIKAITSNVFAGTTFGNASLKNEGLTKKAGVGFMMGVGSQYHFSKKFSVNAMLRFRQNNFSTMEDLGGGYETETDYKYNFISAPILANFRLSPKINFAIGPELNYLVSANSLTRTSGGYMGGGGEEEKEKITDRSTRLGLGLEANLSVQLTKRIGINVGVTKGLTNLDKSIDYEYGSYEGGNKAPIIMALSLNISLCSKEIWDYIMRFFNPANHQGK